MAKEEEIVLKLRLEEAKSKVNIKKFTSDLNELDGRTKEYKLTVAKLNVEEQKLVNTRKKLSQATGELIGDGKKGLTGVSKATGGASTSVLELGRIVSDAPYGIRGMANNVSQLASNMLFGAQQIDKTTGKVVGFTGVLKGMGKAFIGPLGILFAIQAVVAAVDHFYGGMKKAEESLTKFTGLVDKQSGKLMLLKNIMDSSSVSLSEKKEIISDVNNEFEDLNLTIDEQGQLTEKSQQNIDKLTQSLVKNAKAQAVLERITKEQSKIVEIEIDRGRKIFEGGVGAFKGTLEDLESQRQKYIDRNTAQIRKSNLSEEAQATAISNYLKGDAIKRFDALANYRADDVEDAKKNIAELEKIITGESLFSIFDKDTKENKKKKSKLPKLLPDMKEFDKELEDYLSQLDKLYEKTQLIEDKSELEKIEIRKTAHLKRLQVKQDEDIAKFKAQAEAYDREFVAFLDHQVRMGEMTQAEADQSLIDSRSSTDKELSENKSGFTKIIAGWINFYDKKSEAQRKADDKTTGEERLGKLIAFAEKSKEILNAIGDFANAEFDRQITIEQNKTNALNNELNKRLQNENLSKEQRQAIQNQIAQNDEKLRVKQEAIERKRFKMQKAVDISTTIISTAVAMMKALKIYGPTPAGFVAAGLAAAQGAIQVAAIARQKFQTSAGSSPAQATGSSGSSGGRAEPSFNIVGRSNDNILLSAIQSQFDKPLKAYVVARDVTNQQQLDGVISTSAST